MDLNQKPHIINDFYNLHKTDFYHSKTIHVQDKETKRINSFPLPRKILNRNKLMLNEDLISYQNMQKIEKLYQLSGEIDFISFLTLTQYKDLDIKKILNKIKEANRNKFNLKHLTKIYKSEDKAKEKLDINIKKYSQKDSMIWAKSKIKNKILYQLASEKGIYFNNIDDEKIKSSEIDKFKSEHKNELENLYELNKDKYLSKINLDKLEEISRYRIEKNIHDELYYFWTLEYTKQEKEHLHIILNKYIPKSLILEVVNEDYIFDEKFIYDSLIRDKSNSHFFKDNKTQIEKYHNIENNLDYLKTSQKNKIITYITKYLVKDVLKTHKIKLKLDKKINLSQFSSNCYKDFKAIFQKKDSKGEYVGFSDRIISSSSITLEINQSFKPIVKNKLLSEEEHKKRVSIENKQSALINKNLEEIGFFNNNENKEYLQIYEKIIEKYRFLDLDYKDIKILKYLRNKGYQGQDFLKQIKKIISCSYLEEISKEKDKRNYNKYLPKLIENLNPEQQKSILEIINNKITLLTGSAGCGKTYLLSKLQYLYKDFEIVYLTSKNKPAENLKQEIQSLGFENVKCYTISKFLEKRNKSYYVNPFNCKSFEKPLILIIDEIGQVNYTEFNQIISSIRIKSIEKIVLSGDKKQEKAFFGNNMIYELEQLNFIKKTSLVKEVRQKTKKTKKIISRFKKKGKIYCTKIFDFYKEEIILRKILKKKLEANYVFLVNSRRLRNFINELSKELSDIRKIIVDENFRFEEFKFKNGEQYEIINQNQIRTKIKNKDNEFELPNYYIERFFIDGFAMTIDKVQGLGFDNVCVFYDDYSKRLLSNNKYYTAISRTKERIEVFFQNKEIIETIKKTQNKDTDLISYSNYYKLKNLDIGSYPNLNLSPPTGI